SNGAPGALSRSNDLLADHMVDIAPKAGFLSIPLAQQLAGTGRLTLLEPLPQSSVPDTQADQFGTAVHGPVTVGGDVHYPEVNPKHVRRLGKRGVNILGTNQKPPAALLVPNQVRFRQLDGPRKLLSLLAADSQRHPETTVQGGNTGQRRTQAVEPWRVQHHGGSSLELVPM